MVRPLRALGVVTASLFLAVIFLLGLAAVQGENVTFADVAYVLLAAGGQALVPFLLFFAGMKFLLRRLGYWERGSQTWAYYLATAMTAALLVVAAMSWYDWWDNRTAFLDRGWMRVLQEYNLFLVFVPLSVWLDYLSRTFGNRHRART